MKLALALAFLSGASAFSEMTMMARGGAKKSAVPAGPVEKKSIALPYSTTTLDTGLAGDFGFDPFNLAVREPKYPPFDTLRWYREAELQHGRVAQLAFLGFIWPSIFGTFPSQEGYDYSALDPIEALYTVPNFAWIQIILFIGALEGRRYQRCFKGDCAPGDQNIGVPGGFNPFQLNYTEEQYAEKEVQEIKHCRLAMLGAIGALFQDKVSGVGPAAQWAQAFSIPEFSSKAGYYFPDGL
jgi:hypothetical protein